MYEEVTKIAPQKNRPRPIVLVGKHWTPLLIYVCNTAITILHRATGQSNEFR